MIHHDSRGHRCDVCGHPAGSEVVQILGRWLCYRCAAEWIGAHGGWDEP